MFAGMNHNVMDQEQGQTNNNNGQNQIGNGASPINGVFCLQMDNTMIEN